MQICLKRDQHSLPDLSQLESPEHALFHHLEKYWKTVTAIRKDKLGMENDEWPKNQRWQCEQKLTVITLWLKIEIFVENLCEIECLFCLTIMMLSLPFVKNTVTSKSSQCPADFSELPFYSSYTLWTRQDFLIQCLLRQVVDRSEFPDFLFFFHCLQNQAVS